MSAAEDYCTICDQPMLRRRGTLICPHCDMQDR